jgi:hypothetical protein
LGKLITAADELRLAAANHFHAADPLGNQYLGLISRASYVRRPAFYAFKMFSSNFGERLVHRHVESDYYVVGADTIGYITAYTSRSVAGDTLYLIAVNKHDTLDYETTIEIAGFDPDTIARVYTLNGDSLYATNEEDPTAVSLKETNLTVPSTRFSYTFPAHSATAIEFPGWTAGEGNGDGPSGTFGLARSGKNPFDSSTSLQYSLAQWGPVKLGIYNILGQLVKTLVDEEMVEPDRYTVIWDGHDRAGEEVASGIYFAVFKTYGFRATEKLILLR